MSDDRYRCSFDSVADRYERARPAYADDAVAWIAGRLPFRRVLDLAAGTGKLTRQLVARGAEVIATLDASPLFAEFDERTFRHSERLDADTIVDRVTSVSAVAAAAPKEQARVEARVRALVREGEVDFPLLTSVIVSDRV